LWAESEEYRVGAVPAPHPESAIAVVIVCHDSAPELERTLPALAAQLRDTDEVVVVDNASQDASADRAAALLPAATVLRAPGNVGFAEGCRLGAGASSAPLLLLLNPDAVPAPGCLDALRAAGAAHPGWGAWQALVTMDGGARVNSSGNLVHWLGFGWAGGLDGPADAVDPADREVGFASGAAMVVRRAAWAASGGFDRRYFMYGEDLDLSLRLRLAGWGIGIAPAARADHDYGFAKGDYKWFHLERNRWWTVLADYPAPVLACAAPGLLAFEVALLGAAWRGGWLRAKLRAQAAVLRALPAILRRRRAVQRTRVIGSRAFAAGLTTSLDSPQLPRVAALAAAQAAYWRAVTRWLG
jgi:N-acetylglucosaminyl-diphospho-decaprenol L-rhamnosyltransferase